MNYPLYPLGDRAIIIEFGTDIHLDTHHIIQAVSSFLDDHPMEWMIEYIPAFTSLAIYYDPMKIRPLHSKNQSPYEIACTQIRDILSQITNVRFKEPSTIEIPVYYGGDYGPDLKTVAKVNHLTSKEVIEIHTGGEYLVYMIGFAPGFPYLGGMSESIAAPRRETPRLKIPARSVGIAGNQTGIYPIETPGGWQIIGRTPIELFKPTENPPSLLKAGDIIRFKSINIEEYKELEAKRYDQNH